MVPNLAARWISDKVPDNKGVYDNERSLYSGSNSYCILAGD